MIRRITDRIGRRWTIESTLEWRTPATQVDFEHDISSGRGPALVMAAMVVVLAVILIVWTPPDVVVPGWLILLIVLLLLFFPLRWVLRRPYTVIAARGDDGNGNPEEQWRGTVRGVFKSRQQVYKIARTIAVESQPGFAGPLKPVVTQPVVPVESRPNPQDDDGT